MAFEARVRGVVPVEDATNELKVTKGQILSVTEVNTSGWAYCKTDSDEGWVPCSCIEPTDYVKPQPPPARAPAPAATAPSNSSPTSYNDWKSTQAPRKTSVTSRPRRAAPKPGARPRRAAPRPVPARQPAPARPVQRAPAPSAKEVFPFGTKFNPNTGEKIPKFDPDTGRQNY